MLTVKIFQNFEERTCCELTGFWRICPRVTGTVGALDSRLKLQEIWPGFKKCPMQLNPYYEGVGLFNRVMKRSCLPVTPIFTFYYSVVGFFSARDLA